MKTKLTCLLLLAAAAVCAVGAATAGAAGPPPPTRTNGHGHWFRHVCSLPDGKATGCQAQVVTNVDGVALASTSPPASALGPADFHTGYALPTSAPGTPTVAIVDAFDDPSIETDLAAYDNQYGLPLCTTANGCFRKVDQNGGTTYPSGTSWHLEIALDVEVAHAICQNCKILLVEATNNSLANLGTAVNRAVTMGASVVSNSYGAGEYSGETSDENAYFNHPGVAITVSSGDGGYGVEFPAASRYVTAVGGTSLHLNSDRTYNSETVWNGSGSGCSAYEPKPAWQTDTGCARRTVADVAADADPNTGAAIYDSVGTSGGNAWYQVGGTSLSAPLVGAVYALAGNASVNYGSIPYSHAASLHDVTSGTNGNCGSSYLCTGAPGYDGPTGLGTPDGLGGFTAGSPAPDFSLAASPSSRTVTQGSGTTYGVTLTPANGFADPVGLSVSGLPAGAGGSFSPASVSAASPASTLAVTTLASTTPGTYPLTISGTNGTLTRATSATLVVQAQVAKANPTLSTAASAGVALGGSVHDTGTLAGGTGPTGTLAFNLYGASDPGCLAAPVFTSTVTVSGNASYTSASYVPTQAGTYHWVASYSGDAGNNGVGGACGAAGESVTVTAGPTLTVSTTSVKKGGNITVSWSGVASPSKTDWIGSYVPGSANTAPLHRIYDSSCNDHAGATAKASGSCSFKMPDRVGTYELRLLANNGFTLLATSVSVTVTQH